MLKNKCSTERFELQNNFTLNSHHEGNPKRQNSGNPYQFFWKCLRAEFFFCTNAAKVNISMVKVFVQRNCWRFKTAFLKLAIQVGILLRPQ